MPEPLLKVENLVSAFDTDNGQVTAVDGVSFGVEKGKTLGLVGESGCGKSVTALSIIRLLPQPMGHILDGKVLFGGRDLVQIPEAEIHKVRGGQIGMIFQEPLTALNPVHRIGKQLSEVFLLHKKFPKRKHGTAPSRSSRKWAFPPRKCGLPNTHTSFQVGCASGVVIAMALACKPGLVIADEPTTALDVTIQAQILELMKELQAEMGMSIIMITHDLGVIAETCDDVVVMYAGRVAEKGSVEDIFQRPAHLYTKGLLESIPRLETERKSRLQTIKGYVPGLHELPVGARFAPRSPHPDAPAYIRSEAYRQERPELIEVAPGHWVEDHPVVRVDKTFA